MHLFVFLSTHKKKLWLSFFGIALLLIITIWLISIMINHKSKNFIYKNQSDVPHCYTGIVLGAFVKPDGEPSDILRDRLDVGIELYKSDKIKRLLLTGDHGQLSYDEVNHMKNYLLKNGIKTEDIFLDHAGFDTYNSMFRAKKIFQIDKAIIITQEFHLSRAVYLARSQGIVAFGVMADKRKYKTIQTLILREYLAKVKAFYEVTVHKKPKFLGSEIPITGDSQLSYD